MEVMVIEPANLPDVKPATGKYADIVQKYCNRIQYWKEKATTMPAKTNSPSYNMYELNRTACAAKLLQCEFDIVSRIRKIGECYLEIGKNLLKIRDDGLSHHIPSHDDTGFVWIGFEDYVETRFGLKKSSAYALINVYLEFATAKGELKPEYEGFGYSQLVEMLPMNYNDRQKVTSDMTVKQIRELRQERTQKDKEVDSAIRGIDNLLKPANVPPVVVESVEIIEPDEKSEQSIGFQTSGNDDPDEARITYFKNDTERKAFLDAYLTWPKWLTVSAIELDVYRVQLTDGATILAFEYTSRAIPGVQKEYRGRKFLLCKPGEKLCLDFYDTAPTYIIQYLSKEKAGAYWRDLIEG